MNQIKQITIDYDCFQAIIAENKQLKEENEQYYDTCEGLIKLSKQLRKENQKLHDKINNLTIADLSEEAQIQAGHALARELLGGH